MAAVSSVVRHRYSDKHGAPKYLEALLRRAVGQCSELPVGVQHVSFTHINSRVFDADLFQTLTNQDRSHDNKPDWAARIEKRKENLRDYVGRHLICVFIRLPSLHYTIEIDLNTALVVHWEWQRI